MNSADLFLAIIVAGAMLSVPILWLRAKLTPKPRRFGRIRADGSYAIEVVGESHYLDNLRSIAGRGEVRLECAALLVPDDDNRHDKNAVKVIIQGKQVGHLSRKLAREYRAKMAEQGMGDVVAEVPAIIVGGGKDKPNLGVWLDLPAK
jgi:hypothetical protein